LPRREATGPTRPPHAHTSSSSHPALILRERSFSRAHALCKGSCRFTATAVGTTINLTVTGLRRRSTYYYAITARDNVSGKLGPRFPTARIRTR
jgi:hypothetical protein